MCKASCATSARSRSRLAVVWSGAAKQNTLLNQPLRHASSPASFCIASERAGGKGSDRARGSQVLQVRHSFDCFDHPILLVWRMSGGQHQPKYRLEIARGHRSRRGESPIHKAMLSATSWSLRVRNKLRDYALSLASRDSVHLSATTSQAASPLIVTYVQHGQQRQRLNSALAFNTPADPLPHTRAITTYVLRAGPCNLCERTYTPAGNMCRSSDRAPRTPHHLSPPPPAMSH
jgi:hypothetical protein